MRVSVHAPASQIYVDGDAIENCNLSRLPSDVRVIHWDSNKASGWIEYYQDDSGEMPNNTIITSFDTYSWVIDEWNRLDAIRKIPYVNTPEDNKGMAKFKLAVTDYVYLPDVNITNTAAFDTYRAQIRNIFFNPTAGDIDWPTEPTPVWS